MPLVLFQPKPAVRLPLRCSGMSSTREFWQIKKDVVVPEEGWNDTNFRTQNGVRLIQTLTRVKRAAVAKGMRPLAAELRTFFTEQINDVCARVEKARLGNNYKDTITISASAHEDLWAQAIKEAFKQSNIKLGKVTASANQSVVVETNRKVSMLLGADWEESTNTALDKRVAKLAGQVTGINKTTEKKLTKVVKDQIKAGNTVYDTVQAVKKNVAGIALNRIPTIVRTTMGRAADEGMKQAYKESQVVTYISVIGCEAEEPTAPTYNGVCTCNIEDVPVHDIDLLEFHINHTGTMVPSKFAGEDDDGNEQPTDNLPDPATIVADQLASLVSDAVGTGELPEALPEDAPAHIPPQDVIPEADLPNAAEPAADAPEAAPAPATAPSRDGSNGEELNDFDLQNIAAFSEDMYVIINEKPECGAAKEMKAAVAKLPYWKPTKEYNVLARRMGFFTTEEAEEKMKKWVKGGQVTLDRTFTSFSKANSKTLITPFNDSVLRPGTVRIVVESPATAKSIEEYSSHPEELECIYPQGTKFVVTRRVDDAEDGILIYVKEVTKKNASEVTHRIRGFI